MTRVFITTVEACNTFGEATHIVFSIDTDDLDKIKRSSEFLETLGSIELHDVGAVKLKNNGAFVAVNLEDIEDHYDEGSLELIELTEAIESLDDEDDHRLIELKNVNIDNVPMVDEVDDWDSPEQYFNILFGMFTATINSNSGDEYYSKNIGVEYIEEIFTNE